MSLPSKPSFINVGDLDVPGNTITVEAVFYLTGIGDFEGDIVSKHNTPADVNYLLRANHGYITTDAGYFGTPDICEAELNKWYHIAMVYDGSTLKFYRNGFLMSQTNANGNLFQNNWQTQIGWYAPQFWNSNFIGFVNEVRIWNVARTQSQIKAYMNSSLPNPTSQTGLLAYYTFDNLLNKQGNAAWNGSLNGSAAISATVPNCNFIADSCKILSSPATCNGSLGNPVVNITFGNGATNPGPQLSTAVPGANTSYNFGAYCSGNPPNGPFDGDYALLNAVPIHSAWYTGATDHTGDPNGYMAFFNAAPTPGDFYNQTIDNLCPGTTYEFSAWVANVINPVTFPVSVLPDITFKIVDPTTSLELATYNTGGIPTESSMKWKQYSFLFAMPANINSVKLVLANNNVGGEAQPGNDLAIDDITFRPCGPLTTASFSNSSLVTTKTSACSPVTVYGSVSGGLNNPAYQWQLSKDGGQTYTSINGATNLTYILNNTLNGDYYYRLLSAESTNINSINCRFISNEIKLTIKPDIDSIAITKLQTACQTFSLGINEYPSNAIVTSWQWDFNDGTQANTASPSHTFLSTGIYNVKLSATSSTGCIVTDTVTINIKSLPITVSNDTTLCKNSSAQLTAAGGNTYSWSPATGLNNAAVANPIATPASTTTFFVQVKDANGCVAKDSVLVTVNPLPALTITDDTAICINASLQLNVSGATKYTWSPATGLSSSNIANPNASPAITTKYIVTGSDANNCSSKDSVTVTVNPLPVISLTADTAICLNKNVQLVATGGVKYNWSPATGLNNSTVSNPVAAPGNTTTYSVEVTGTNNCKSSGSITVTVKSPAPFTVTPDTSICTGSLIQLSATGGDQYVWSPANLVSNASLNNPTTSPAATTVYTVKISEPVCNTSGTLSTRVTVLPRPVISVSKSNDISCSKSAATLSASGALQYTWTPAATLSSANTASPVASPLANTTYIVTGTDTNQCSNTASVTVLVSFSGKSLFFMPNSFSPNGDGLNDCFRLKYYGPVFSFQLSIYNRLGQRVFNSSNPSFCWDGKFNGQNAPIGNYIYHLQANTACGSVDKKGNLILVR